MDGALREWMKTGIVQFMAYPDSLADPRVLLSSVEAIMADGFFDGIEVTEVQDQSVRSRLAAILKDSGLEVWFGVQSIQVREQLNLNSDDVALRERSVSRLKEAFMTAHSLGARAVALMSGPDPGASRREQAIPLLVESLICLSRFAAEIGLGVVLEVFDRDVDRKALIGSTADAVRVAKAVRSETPNFGLQLDLAHIPLMGESALESVGLAASYLDHIHIGNCIIDPSVPGYGDTHPPFGVPGGAVGVQELAEFLRALVKVGYLKAGSPRTVYFEVRPRPGESPELIIEQNKQVLEAAWQLV